jgi:predicted outer membrane repeat protein
LFALACLLHAPRSAAAQSPVFVDDSVNDGLVAHWRLDQTHGAGNTLTADLVGGFAGTLVGSPLLTDTVPAPIVDYSRAAMTFRSGGRMEADAPALRLVNDVTLSMWVKLDDGAPLGVVAAVGSPGPDITSGDGWVLRLGANEVAITFYGPGIGGGFGNAATSVGTAWRHVVVRLSGGTTDVFLDGVSAISGSGPSGAAATAGLRLGALAGGAEPFAGVIDDVRFFNRPLTDAEILRLAQGNLCLFDGSTWDLAFREIQCGLNEVAAGGEVRVAQGTYYPGSSAQASNTISQSLTLRGGFLGLTAPSVAERNTRPIVDPVAGITVINGDVLGNDGANFANRADNVNVLVRVTQPVSLTLDGLRLTAGDRLAGPGAGVNDQGGNTANWTLRNMGFVANRSGEFGAAISTFSSSLRVESSAFLSNTAQFAGGAIWSNSPPVVVASSWFSGNLAANGGGAIFGSGLVSVTLSSFVQNQAISGGAINASDVLTLTGSVFNQNSASDGGAVRATGSRSWLEGNQFIANTAQQSGGGASISSPDAVFLDNYWYLNSADGGGALEVNRAAIQGDRFEGNSGSFGASAIQAFESIAVLRTSFRENFSTGWGTLSVNAPNEVSLIANSLFYNNVGADTVGADIVARGNSASGVFLVNNTHRTDSAAAEPFAISLSEAGAQLRNSIISGYATAAVTTSMGAAVSESFNLFQGNPPTVGGTPAATSFTGDPLFVDPAGFNLRLQLASPAIDVGNTTGLPVLQPPLSFATDLDDNPRQIKSWANRPGIIDLGAYEFQATASDAVLDPPTTGFEGNPLTLSAGSSLGQLPLTFGWDCTSNGSFEQSGANASVDCTYADDGAFTARLVVTGSTGLTDSTTAPVVIENLAPAVALDPAPRSAFAGVAQSFDFGTLADPGALDAPWTVTIDWGDGSPDTVFQRTALGALPAQNHTYATAGNRTVTVTAASVRPPASLWRWLSRCRPTPAAPTRAARDSRSTSAPPPPPVRRHSPLRGTAPITARSSRRGATPRSPAPTRTTAPSPRACW